MKKISLFSCALAALMLGACSNEAGVTDGDQGIEWNENGKGFVSLAIQLPTQPSTRANDSYDDGTPAEYEVKNATLILFVNGVVNSAYGMNLNFSPEGTPTDNVTTTAKITQEINRISGVDPEIKALVVLNHNGVLAVENGVLKVGGTEVTGKNLAELNDAVNAAIGTNYSWHTAGWLMSNAIMSDTPGGSAEPSGAKVVGPLTEIDADKIKKTKGEADASPAAVIYVERAEAKVTVKGSSSLGTVTNGSGLTYTLEGWALDNTNKTNKLVRDVAGFGTWKLYRSSKLGAGTSDYRFIGNIPITSAPSALMYRVYWGDDYNYSGTLTETGLTTVGGAAATLSTVKPADGTTADYCFENTTDLANMTEKNLTRVIVKAKFNNGTSFYTVDGDRSAIWTEANVKKEAAARLLLDVTFNNWAKNNVKSGETLSSETDFYVTFTDEAAGKRTIKTIVLNATGQDKLKTGAAAYPADAATLANNHIKLEYYADGMSYYPVYVKHFGDEQTPWTEDDQTGNTVYGNNPGDYLGRYGMLRNNWYDITVNSVKSLGDPNVVEVTDKLVDKKDAYISVKINVLSWAKRSQSVDL